MGRQVCVDFAEAGATVAGVDGNAAGLQETLAQLKGRVSGYICVVTRQVLR